MSAAAIPGGEEHGEEPRPAMPDGSAPDMDPDGDWDDDADLARIIAAVDAGLIPIPPEGEAVPGVWFSVAGVADPAEIDLGGLAQGGPLNVMPPDAVLAALATEACDPAVLATLTDDQVLGLAAAGRRLAARGRGSSRPRSPSSPPAAANRTGRRLARWDSPRSRPMSWCPSWSSRPPRPSWRCPRPLMSRGGCPRAGNGCAMG